MDPDTRTTVVVTGVGAIIGQGIVRSLRQVQPPVRIVGVDRNQDCMGRYLCDAFHAKPDCDEDGPGYRAFWRELLARETARIVMPGLDVDVAYLARHRAQLADTGVALCLNTDAVIALGEDKWRLAEALRTAGGELAAMAIPGMVEGDWASCLAQLGSAPLLMKPRRGSAGRGIVRLHDETDFHYWRHKAGRDFMVQRLVGSDEEEYTVGIFGLGDGDMLAPLIFRRRLGASGSTGYAEVSRDPAIAQACARLCAYFKPLGPTNFQFRKEGSRVFLLEINPRFSSSTSLRAAFGFNEAAMAIELFLTGRRPELAAIRAGRAWRYAEDYVQHDLHSF